MAKGAWVSVGDAALRSNLLSEAVNLGDAIITVKQTFSGAVARKLHDKIEEIPSVMDAGAIGNSTTNDTASFTKLEAAITGRDIDLHGRTYLVDAVPSGNRYFNGKFLVSGITHDSNYVLARNINNVVTTVGNSGTSIPANYNLPEINRFTYRNGSFASGGALNKAAASGQTVAIGPDAMGNTLMSFDNIGMGECALQNVQSKTDSYSTTDTTGTRNVAIGGNAGQFITDGLRNVLMGRNVGVSLVNNQDVVALGANVFGGQAFSGWYDYIENFIPNVNVTSYTTAVGSGIGQYYSGNSMTAFGYNAAKNMKNGDSNIILGDMAGRDLEIKIGWNGYVNTPYDSSIYVTYIKTGNNVVVNAPGHGAVVGGKANIYWAAGGPAYANHGHAFPVSVIAVSGDAFTVNCPYIGDGTGNARLFWTTSTAQDQNVSRHNLFAGSNTGLKITQSTNSVLLGSLAAQLYEGSMTTTIAIGYGVMQNFNSTTAPNSLVAIGTNALRDNSGNIGAVTAIGHNAGLLMQDGSIPTVSIANCTLLGSNSRVSGVSQVQLGGAGTTPYAYNALQLRSDSRDKYKVRDTELGIDFIMGLRPVQGVWNLRDFYLSHEDVENGISTDADGVETIIYKAIPVFDEDGYKSATKSGTRFHNWFIAQEVQELCKKLGVDFAGLQDHSVNGGCDVLSLAYEEFIPPIVKSIQECWSRLEELERRVSLLE